MNTSVIEALNKRVLDLEATIEDINIIRTSNLEAAQKAELRVLELERMLHHEGIEHSEAQAHVLKMQADIGRLLNAGECDTVDELADMLENYV